MIVPMSKNGLNVPGILPGVVKAALLLTSVLTMKNKTEIGILRWYEYFMCHTSK